MLHKLKSRTIPFSKVFAQFLTSRWIMQFTVVSVTVLEREYLVNVCVVTGELGSVR